MQVISPEQNAIAITNLSSCDTSIGINQAEDIPPPERASPRLCIMWRIRRIERPNKMDPRYVSLAVEFM
jgi:hypothetical protein